MYSTMYADSFAETSMIAGILGMVSSYMVVIIALVVLSVVAKWKIYSKAGKPGWASLIPIYNTVVMFQIVGLNPWLLCILLVPFVGWIAGVVFIIMVSFRLAKSFGKDIGWGFGLWLLSTIFNLILAFGSSEYVGPNGEREEKVEAKVVENE